MAYNKDGYQLSHLLQDAWQRMGQLRKWLVTGGSTTTVVNTDWALTEEPQFEDDDPSLIFGTAVVVTDAGGAGAAPEGEFGMITDYDSASSTLTMDAISSAVESGDRIGIVSPLFPLEDMISLANIALRRIGDIDLLDTSLVSVGGQIEYTMPVAIKQRPIRIRVRGNISSVVNHWEEVQGWSVNPATAGTAWTLVLPEMVSGNSIEILYRSFHPELTAFDSPIQEAVHPELILCALVAEAYQWYNNQVGGSNQYFLQRENKAIQDYEAAKVMNPVRHITEQVQGLPHWNNLRRRNPTYWTV
jgi:hypothetical protein